MPHRIEIPCDELRSAYAAGQSTDAISERYGCSPATIINRLRQCGIPVRPPGFQPACIPETTLRRLYLDERLPIAEIAACFGVAVSAIGNVRRRYGIPVRPRRVPSASDDSGEE